MITSNAMTKSGKQAWENIRAGGRDRFLLTYTLQCWWLLVAGLLVELCWWLFSGNQTKPMWEVAVGWILVAIGTGAWGGILEWNTNERNYCETNGNTSA